MAGCPSFCPFLIEVVMIFAISGLGELPPLMAEARPHSMLNARRWP
jgi:hypothetical protein